WTLRNLIGLAVPFHPWARLPLPVMLGLDAVVSALTLGGLALLPLLWRPLSRRWLALVCWAYAVWLALLVILAAAGFIALRQAVPLAFSLSKQFGAFGSYHALPGVIVFPLGALVVCAALVLLFREPAPVALPAPAPRGGWQRAATLTLTAGALVWVVGFYLMPQAVTTACPPVSFSVTQFAHGACAGIDSDQVLQWAWYAGLNPVASLLYTLGRNFELLVALVAITTLGGWTRLLSVTTLAWLAAWPALAFGVALVALQGVGVVARYGFQLAAETGGSWHAAPGIAVTLAGIILVALGQLGLWREWARQRAATPAR
ncbi:MAG TPA: hypothetical protein VF725_13635, partial [Ktedonobacterales bacterium]